MRRNATITIAVLDHSRSPHSIRQQACGFVVLTMKDLSHAPTSLPSDTNAAATHHLETTKSTTELTMISHVKRVLGESSHLGLNFKIFVEL
jgi:hypothetical protein